ncbi:MAG: ATP-binding protein [Saprospiraceae bacterium]|nr:ATP-binding protein [Saprospiraceae bacterium]
MSAGQSPFKFLDAYTVEDRQIFFGRDDEIEELYKLLYETNLILVYGPSGAGKTSLIQCGLASKFEKTDWFHITVRRREDINESLRREIRKRMRTAIDEEEQDLVQLMESLFLDFFVPITLIFDQFEELYILGSEEERARFVADVARLVSSEVNCNLIFVMREEYIAQLYDFEREVPTLFQKRIRIEPMSVTNVRKVIQGSAEAFNITLQPEEETITRLIDQISDRKAGVQLSYLQIYLDKLYREAS